MRDLRGGVERLAGELLDGPVRGSGPPFTRPASASGSPPRGPGCGSRPSTGYGPSSPRGPSMPRVGSPARAPRYRAGPPPLAARPRLCRRRRPRRPGPAAPGRAEGLAGVLGRRRRVAPPRPGGRRPQARPAAGELPADPLARRTRLSPIRWASKPPHWGPLDRNAVISDWSLARPERGTLGERYRALCFHRCASDCLNWILVGGKVPRAITTSRTRSCFGGASSTTNRSDPNWR
jgi:hypothetical protein